MQVSNGEFSVTYQSADFQNNSILSNAYGSLIKIIQSQSSDQEKVRAITAIFVETIQLSQEASSALALKCLDELEQENIMFSQAKQEAESRNRELEERIKKLIVQINEMAPQMQLIKQNYQTLNDEHDQLKREKQELARIKNELETINAELVKKVESFALKEQELQAQQQAIDERVQALEGESDQLQQTVQDPSQAEQKIIQMSFLLNITNLVKSIFKMFLQVFKFINHYAFIFAKAFISIKSKLIGIDPHFHLFTININPEKHK
jgi:chromosome segregation ATPase